MIYKLISNLYYIKTHKYTQLFQKKVPCICKFYVSMNRKRYLYILHLKSAKNEQVCGKRCPYWPSSFPCPPPLHSNYRSQSEMSCKLFRIIHPRIPPFKSFELQPNNKIVTTSTDYKLTKFPNEQFECQNQNAPAPWKMSHRINVLVNISDC